MTPPPRQPPVPSGAQSDDEDPTGISLATASATSEGRHLNVSGLTYEAARDELVAIVARLESGKVPLEESMQLWERGEALADHCAAWLDGAERRLRREDDEPAAAPTTSGRGGVQDEDEGDDERAEGDADPPEDPVEVG